MSLARAKRAARASVTLLLVASVAGVTPAVAQPPAAPADYTITVDPAATGPRIDRSMYGVFFEDINFAADGGLYAELVRNRSFEFLPADNGSYTGLTAWTATGGTGATAVVTSDDARLNERNRTYLKVEAPFTLTNAGYDQGFAVRAGATYDFSVWARSTAPAGTQLTVGLGDASDEVAIAVQGDAWKQYTGTLKAGRTTDAGRLTLRGGGAGTVRLDEVSIFPRDTFKGRRNGLRKDLAEKIAALHPGFVRFPGGCLVNTGSMYGYDAASGFPRARAYQWKDTVGPVETRAANANFWGYNQSYGLGYFEYLQFAEDIGAMPLPVVPALVTGCGQNRATVDDALLRRHIQDTLDLIEFANGPADSTWGRLRADMGHPAPFHLTHVAVGNEENLPNEYFANFVKYEAAIKARYPDITVISNSGPDDQGFVFDLLWRYNREAGVDMVDEHYYNSPAWFLQNNKRYDAYDRNGPKVFLGEYASLDGKLYNALAEAAYMTGLERNADVVKMASYAPLLANIDHVQWRPDMIWFDNDESWGTTSYQVQKLFMNNVGDRVVPSRATGKLAQPKPITGALGLSTWATAAVYDDVKVTAPDGTVLFSDDFSAGSGQWTPVEPRGTWSVADGGFLQSDTAALDTLIKAGHITATDYDYTLKATKRSGAEGFLVAFGVQESGELYWWNLGGWNNTLGAIQKGAGGGKEMVISKPNTIATGVTYDIKIEVRGTSVRLYLNGELWGGFDDDKVAEPFAQVVTQDEATGDLIVKVVNAQDTSAVTKIDLGRRKVRGTARMTVISGDPGEQNTRSAEPIQPVTTDLKVAPAFTHTFAPNSVTFIRIRTR
ncbi:alpha-L-arabinofuranosidase C-terminal domain-containing protein [Dactylosporangium sp. NPDC049742]|uniref:alpha-L-arabinofuranosidase C-terminal domain-containing protein n=1 Tax=Dactylosporangium sp. NPDC049742 TaxID=3154737 RepID=UPI00343AAD86